MEEIIDKGSESEDHKMPTEAEDRDFYSKIQDKMAGNKSRAR